jgi:hypothetical protein
MNGIAKDIGINIMPIITAVSAWNNPIGLTPANKNEDPRIAADIAIINIGKIAAITTAFAPLIPSNPFNNLPNPKPITANTPAIKIAVIAWNNPIGLTPANKYDEPTMAAEIAININGKRGINNILFVFFRQLRF